MEYGIRKNVYLFPSDMKNLNPVLEKNHGNISKSLRECVEFTEFALEKIGSIERAKEILFDNQTNDLRVGDRIVLRVEKVIRLGSKENKQKRMHGAQRKSTTQG